MQLSYVIVDDDEISRLAVQAEAEKFSFLDRGHQFTHALEGAEFIKQFHPDVIFADIEMPGISGIEMIRNAEWKSPVVIFITSHPEFALDSYELDAFDYLLKPVTSERFAKCALRIADFFSMRSKAGAFDSQQEKDFIVIKEGYDKHKISISDIQYVEAMKDYVKIVVPARSFLVLETLARMQERLVQANFLRIHRSYLVNRDRITSVMNNKICIGATELPVGKLYKEALASAL